MRTSNENVRRERHSAQDSRRAFTLISALKSFDTGQPVSAAFTAASNFALSAPGTRATRSRWLLVIAKPSGSLSSVIVAVVSSLLAVMPALPSCAERAMVKQPACAAARSSSGFVPTPFSNLVLNEYCVCFSTPLSVEMVPFPSFKPPCQTADALRCIISLLLALSFDANLSSSIPELLGRVYSENDLVEKALRAWMSAVLQGVAHRPLAGAPYLNRRSASSPLVKDQESPEHDARKARGVIPSESFSQIRN